MARLSDNEINQLKTNVSLVALVESSGITLKKQGKDYLGHCPFHNDKSPSLLISPDKNLWHCLGACSEGGDVIQWVMKREGLAFRKAVAWLGSDLAVHEQQSLAQSKAQAEREAEVNTALDDDIGSDSNSKAKSLKNIKPSQATPSLAANPDDQALLGKILDHYHAALKQTPKALDYLASRGLMHPDLISTFKLGFADASLSQLLPPSKVKAGAEIRNQLKRFGIIRARGQAHFLGCLVFPVLGVDGVIGEVYGRRIASSIKPGSAEHLYLPHAHQGVFNEIVLASMTDEIILCESIIDALTFWVAGYRNVTASYGTSGFTDDHLIAFKKHSIKRVLIAYDRDEAGNKAAEKLAEKLNLEGIECFRVLFPKGMDANSYALDVKPAEKSLGLVLRSAQWMGKGQKPGANKTATKTKAKLKPLIKITPKLKQNPSQSQKLIVN